MVGAAAAVARLLELDADRTSHALGIAATQAAGHREQLGAMTKSLHAGRAAEGGVTAALLAARGFTAAPASLEHTRHAPGHERERRRLGARRQTRGTLGARAHRLQALLLGHGAANRLPSLAGRPEGLPAATQLIDATVLQGR